MLCVCFVEIDKLEYRVVMESFILCALLATEIHPKFITSLLFHCKLARNGRLSEKRSKTATNNGNIEKINNMIMHNRRSKVYEVVETIDISKERGATFYTKA